jgi:uncharacterized protein YutE (UPF0331/DUF86 family)
MNERIQELALQANTIGDWGEDITEGRYFVYPDIKNLEKFAELIVKECIDICHKMAEDSDSYVVHDGDTCAEQIREHFGVEE